MIDETYDYLVYSPAIDLDDKERLRARELGIPEYSYPEVLGMISRTKKTVTVSGTNGKTTTTAMIIEVLDHLGVSPSGIVGEILPRYQSNYIHGDSDFFIAEACEYRDSFLHIQHDIAIITNISLDHLDYFRDLTHIQDSFSRYLDNRKGHGCLITNTDSETLAPVVAYAQKIGMTVIPYQKFLDSNLKLNVPGEHNKQNAACALALVEHLGYNIQAARNYLGNDFRGARRRLEFIGTTSHGSLVYDDYAHNPEGIEYLIASLKNTYPDKQIHIIFEPHLYSRTRDFKEAFAEALAQADYVYLAPTYRAREPQNPSEDFLLANELEKISASFSIIPQNQNFKEFFESFACDDTVVVVTAGAGPVWELGRKIIKKESL